MGSVTFVGWRLERAEHVWRAWGDVSTGPSFLICLANNVCIYDINDLNDIYDIYDLYDIYYIYDLNDLNDI